ncbi:unnamed protein product [Eruca vesicaria subsp. sativa]|uniref:TF-B3 domain-containing protein n=1 Tax=Eruca vesicaria subsp. sativa TaxID=29727 RepID=A0ABC8JG78_ERUVS|nr:unnamed protein product [Eruca vesicaria subsp. sativa]
MMFPKEREIGSSSGLGQGEVDVENLSFLKIFQGEDLSSESMRAFPYDFIRNVPENDYSTNMVIRTQWGISWEVKVSMNPRFHYMEKRGWNQFVNDNALGDKELVAFTHTGLMCFNVNIYDESGKEVVTPRRRRDRTIASLSGVKKEVRESRKAEKTGGVRSRRFEGGGTSKKKKKMKNNVEHTVPEFNITITKSYLCYLPIPKHFAEKHIRYEDEVVTIHDSNGNRSWMMICLKKETWSRFASGWAVLAREFPLSVDDICTFKFINPTEYHLVVSEKEIMTD